MDEQSLKRAAAVIQQADAILIGAGAGMGVDSGLPDFRGDEGFWNAYPPYRHLSFSFYDLASPDWFTKDISVAWGFYAHRRNLYRKTKPHDGFRILLKWAKAKRFGTFVYTSNVDYQFQRAGFHPRTVVECHGTIERSQCLSDCGIGSFKADPKDIVIDEETMRAQAPIPSCPNCHGAARPNILMFSDWQWDGDYEDLQAARLHEWLESIEAGQLAVIELGAGEAIPTVRWFCERQAQDGNTLIRINPRDSEVLEGHIGLRGGALEVLQKLEPLVL